MLAVYLLLRLFYNMLHCNFNEIDKLRNCVTAPDVHPYFLTPHLFCHNGVLAIRHTNDCVSNPVISGTLRSVRPGGLYRYLRIVRFLEVSVTVQLHGFTLEIINTLSVSKLFAALLAIYLLF